MIDLGELQITLTITDRTIEGAGGPYLEWFQFQVKASVPGFTAEVKWAAMPMELVRFRDELIQMNNMIRGAKADLKGIEPGVQLHLSLGGRGQIQGNYEISDQYSDPKGARLQGEFTIDQTFLGNIIAEVDALLAYQPRKLGA